MASFYVVSLFVDDSSDTAIGMSSGSLLSETEGTLKHLFW